MLTDIEKLIIIETITDRPNTFLREIKEIFAAETGTDVSLWQKTVLVTKQRDDFQQATLSLGILKCLSLLMRLEPIEGIV